ncbi:hypothetical protein [Faecalispora jeddahensis]|uniref:hypothetical protein n=1 Tax=Faecalispora jeddahensis TaxID=1414721 RepID=UPI003992F186
MNRVFLGVQLRRLYSHLKKQARQIIGGPVSFGIVFLKASYFKENSFIQCYVFYGAFYPWYDKEGKTNRSGQRETAEDFGGRSVVFARRCPKKPCETNTKRRDG